MHCTNKETCDTQGTYQSRGHKPYGLQIPRKKNRLFVMLMHKRFDVAVYDLHLIQRILEKILPSLTH